MFGPNHCEKESSSPQLRKALSRLNLLDSRYQLPTAFLDPNLLPDLNGMGVSGSCMAPTLPDGCRVNVTKTEPYARGDAPPPQKERWRDAVRPAPDPLVDAGNPPHRDPSRNDGSSRPR